MCYKFFMGLYDMIQCSYEGDTCIDIGSQVACTKDALRV